MQESKYHCKMNMVLKLNITKDKQLIKAGYTKIVQIYETNQHKKTSMNNILIKPLKTTVNQNPNIKKSKRNLLLKRWKKQKKKYNLKIKKINIKWESYTMKTIRKNLNH